MAQLNENTNMKKYIDIYNQFKHSTSENINAKVNKINNLINM